MSASKINIADSAGMLTLRIDPISELARWIEFVQRHPSGSVFHSPGWLDALRRTYGYEAAVYTTTPAGERLRNAWLFCGVKSWVTGNRLVSVPFADHCEPLLENPEDLSLLSQSVQQDVDKGRWRYAECRPLSIGRVPGFGPSKTYALHKLNLQPSLEFIFGRLHGDCIRRKIRRAERERLTVEEGRSEAALDKFYSLLIMTRRRHGIPPQPRRWFANLADCLGDQLNVYVASAQGTPVAAIVVLRYKGTTHYKYGASDLRFSGMGGMQWILWRAIQDAKQSGALEFDFGRSDIDQEGLITFKNRWGAERTTVNYYRYPGQPSSVGTTDWATRLSRDLASHLPSVFLRCVGNAIYRHLG
jgi:CelD/BcsL family acetyltransferase involved in cellulose biosynthesis